jgi:transposase
MLERRLHVIEWILRGFSDYAIEKATGHCHKFCRKIRKELKDNPGELFIQRTTLGSPIKCSEALRARVDELTTHNRRMTNDECAAIISAEMVPVSRESIRRIRLNLGFSYLPPIHTFFLTPTQIQNRLRFAQREIAQPRDWGSVIFTDESYFWLGEDNRALWRKRGERGPDVEMQTVKFPKKILVFGGISLRVKTNLILIEKGTVDGITYIDECIDQSALIPDMNHAYGAGNWTLMQDGASAHTKAETLEYLNLMTNVLDRWPSGSPDLNPIENLWAIMKTRVCEVGATTIEELAQIIIAVWESLTSEEIAALINSMTDRLWKTIHAEGGHNGY